MPDDVVVTERIFHEGILVAAAGDRINAEDARKWAVGPDGKAQPAVTAAAPPLAESEPADDEPRPAHAEKRPRARTRPARRGENR